MILAPSNARLLTSVETGWPRVPQRVYEGVFIAYLPVIVFATLVRLGLKIRNHRRLEVDDGFLVLALCCSLVAWAFVWQMRDLIYLQMEIVLGMKEIELEDLRSMLVYFKWYNASMVLTWTAIYSVKFSFMFFFRKLVSRIRSLEIYWWAILSILIPSAAFSAFFSFWICTDFSMTYLSNCPTSSMMYREEIYLYATTALDIFTDLLIVSLPIILLSKVSIILKRKVFLAMALCLSIFMIVICIIRVTTCKLPNGIIDSTWLGLWQCIETNTAILMVSLTAFRSLFRQGSSTGYATPVKIKKPPLWPSMKAFILPTKTQKIQENEPEHYGVIPKKPPPAVSFIKRVATQKEINNQLMPSLDPISDSSRESTMTSEREVNVNNPYLWPTQKSLGNLETGNQIDGLDEYRGGV